MNKELQQVQANISAYQEKQKLFKTQKENEESNDDLDSYMENLQAKEKPVDKTEIKKLRVGKEIKDWKMTQARNNFILYLL